jgi:transcriptional regulator with XRE-family HTH domain
MDPLWQTLIQNIEELLAAKGWNQSRLAEASGLSRSAISTYMSGRNMPQLDAVSRIAAALGTTPSRLLAKDREPGMIVKYEKVELTQQELKARLEREFNAASLWSQLPESVRTDLHGIILLSTPERWAQLGKAIAKLHAEFSLDEFGAEAFGGASPSASKRTPKKKK